MLSFQSSPCPPPPPGVHAERISARSAQRRGARLAAPETNGLAASADGSAVYAACGDGHAYAFDSDTWQSTGVFKVRPAPASHPAPERKAGICARHADARLPMPSRAIMHA